MAGRWGGYLSERGAATPEQQVGVLDNLLQTERALATGTPEQKIAIMRKIASDYGVGAPSGGPAPQPHPQAHMQPPPQPQPTGDPLVDQLQQTHAEQQTAAWREGMATAGPQAAQAQAAHRMQQHILAVASETKPDGNPLRPYFADVKREIGQGIMNSLRAGRQPNIAALYDQATAARPDIQAHKIENAHATIRDFASENPVVFDPTIRARMNTIAAGHRRTGRPGDMKEILAEALRREPNIAAKYHRQISHAKAAGRKIEPTIDQQLEAAYAAGGGL